MREIKYDIGLIISVSKQYYEQHLTQDAIAQNEHLSRATISRILQCAQQQGYVKTIVINPLENIHSLEEKVQKTFKLKHVCIVNTISQDSDVIKEAIGRAGAKYLMSIIKSGDVLGITFGTTTMELVRALPETNVPDIHIVSLGGCAYESVLDDHSFDAARVASKKLGGKLRLLYTPVIACTKEVKEAFLTDSNTRRTLEKMDQCNILINGVGMFIKDSMLHQYGYISKEELQRLESKHTVGNICSRYYDINGNTTDQDIDDRTLTFPLSKFREKEYSICLAGSKQKTAAILGALHGKHINVLITDVETAKALLIAQKTYIQHKSGINKQSDY